MFSIYGEGLDDADREAIYASDLKSAGAETYALALGALFGEHDTVLFDDTESQGAAEDISYVLEEFRMNSVHVKGSQEWWDELTDILATHVTDHNYRAAFIAAAAMNHRVIVEQSTRADNALTHFPNPENAAARESR